MNPHDQQRLERAVHQALHGLPGRSAPASLESRVQAEIARRAALPWWRKSFRHWPSAARIGFVAVSSVLAAGMLVLTMLATSGLSLAPLRATFAPEIQALQGLGTILSSAVSVVASLLNSIPPLWLYGGLATLAGLYLTLFGLGAAAYRTLYVPAHSIR